MTSLGFAFFLLLNFTRFSHCSVRLTFTCGGRNTSKNSFTGLPTTLQGGNHTNWKPMMEGLHDRMGQSEESTLVHLDELRQMNRRMDEIEARWSNLILTQNQTRSQRLTNSTEAISSTPTMVAQQELREDCDSLFENIGAAVNGAYNINIGGWIVEVYCQFRQRGYNWLVFQRRGDGSVNFYRSWNQYKRGFGDVGGEFWLGLNNLHHLTSNKPYRLRVNLEDWDGNTAYAEYSTFIVGSAASNYQLGVAGYHGNASDALSRHNNQPFTTKDRDNDAFPNVNCAKRHRGGWWFKHCQDSNLNGEYVNGTGLGSSSGINWRGWKSQWYYSFKRVEMKLRRK